MACYVGPVGSTAPCGSRGTDGTTASFAAPRLGPSQGLTVVVGLPTGAVPAPRPVLDERWSLVRAFSMTPGTLAVAGAVLLLVLLGLGWLFRAVGGDRRASDGTAAAGAAVEWAPPDGIRPGQAGLLVNGAVRPLDVIATLVDLAIRGYLRIEELPSHRKRTKPDWRLVQLKAADHHLLGYERELFYGLFSSHGNGARVRLSALNKKFYERFDRVRLALYQDAMQRHWFTHRPDRVRRWWVAGGVSMTVLGIAVAVLVVWQTHFGLAAVPLLLAGPIVILRVRSLISRTPEGAALRRRVVGLHTYLKTAGAGGAGAPDEFSSYLPYAMVLGLTEQWTRAPALAGAPPQTDWYGSPAPWSPDRFSSRMHDFAGTSAGTFTSSPPSASGSSGFDGGSSGGGGGGDGGGSW